MATASHNGMPPGGTAIFRPAKVFAALESWVLQELLERAWGERPVRIWIAGCGTGERAHSIAIWFAEHFRNQGRQPNVSIFATDREVDAIQVARAGVFSESDIQRLPATRLRYFFEPHGTDRFRISPAVRGCIEFARAACAFHSLRRTCVQRASTCWRSARISRR